MEINALLMDPADNVVTCVSEVAAGQAVVYRLGRDTLTLTALEAIPYCHKVALVDIGENEPVYKYGEMIGKTLHAIPKGGWVYHENIYSVPRDYDEEMI